MWHPVPRPDSLPDYLNPPLHEVVLGVQFAPPKNYQQVHITEVWNLFRKRFPTVQEKEPLPPEYELLGLPMRSEIKLGLMQGPRHDRFWFISEDSCQVLQFQKDRFLHNWRSINKERKYPRFDFIIKDFNDELIKMEEYFCDFGLSSLEINQCELTYVNQIPLDAVMASKWLRLEGLNFFAPEDFIFQSRRKLAKAGEPYGRIHCDIGTAEDDKARSILTMQLKVRGKPENSSINSALNFLSDARIEIVKTFTAITSDFAHKEWGRIK